MGLPSLYRAAVVNPGAQRADFRHQAKSELDRLDADTLLLPHASGRIAIVAIAVAQFLGAQQADVVIEVLAAYPYLVARCASFSSRCATYRCPPSNAPQSMWVVRCLKFSNPVRISQPSFFAVSRHQRAIHWERLSLPLAFCPCPSLRLQQPQAT